MTTFRTQVKTHLVELRDGFLFFAASEENNRHQLPMRAMVRVACYLALMMALVPSMLRAGEPDQQDTVEMHGLSFVGNNSIDEGALRRLIETQDSPSWLSGFVHTITLGVFGGSTEYYDRDRAETDAIRIENYYRDHGYFGISVKTKSELDSSYHKARLTFLIDEGKRSLIDSLAYLGLESIPPLVEANIQKDPIIRKGQPYEKTIVDAEVARIMMILANNGYPQARLDLTRSSAVRYLSNNNFALTYAFDTGPIYHFDSIEVHIEPHRPDIGDYLITRYLEFAPGDVYSREKESLSERNLNRLDMFETVIISHPRAADSAAHEMPVDISVRARDRFQLAPEISVSDENNAFNLGLGMGFVNRNFLGDARSLTLSADSRLQSLSNWDFHRVFGGSGVKDTTVAGALELSLQVLQPYLFAKTLSGVLTMSVSAEKQPHYILSLLRSKITINDRLALHTFGVVDWALERVSPQFLTTLTPSDSSLLLQYDTQQFNSIITFTIQHDLTNDIFSPSQGSFTSASVEESGILPEL
ncbi:MAG TPA: POTRA domain-containing protein, partial [Bacteroidota bacterium]|nr:POTRA domain-containing protein [Bacteroidota bacterium]